MYFLFDLPDLFICREKKGAFSNETQRALIWTNLALTMTPFAPVHATSTRESSP